MSEKQQRTAAQLRAKMNNRYDDGLPHKHNKSHHSYRQHCRTHPANSTHHIIIEGPSGMVRSHNLKKVRKRLDKGSIH